jgi:hypothetical protein
MRLLNLLIAAALTGCGLNAAETLPLAEPSRAGFEREAAPLLAKRCGDVACHGTERHAFALFAVGRRRIRAVDTFSSRPLSVAELDANFLATLGFLDAAAPLDTTLLRKALGQGHGGDAVFAHPSDPECLAVVRWLEGRPE